MIDLVWSILTLPRFVLAMALSQVYCDCSVASRKGPTLIDHFTQILPLHVKPLRRNVTPTLQGQASKIGIILIMIDSGHRMHV